MRTLYRIAPTLSCLIVAAASFALSYVALRDVSVEIEAVPAHLGWLVPVVVDGGVIGASVVIWAAAAEGRRPKFPVFVVAALVAMSVVINTNHAGPTLLAKVIAGLPPLVLLATLELVAAQSLRSQRAQEERDEVDAVAAVTAELTATVDALRADVAAANDRAAQVEADAAARIDAVQAQAAEAAAAAASAAVESAAQPARKKATPRKKAAARTTTAAKKAAAAAEAGDDPDPDEPVISIEDGADDGADDSASARRRPRVSATSPDFEPAAV